MEVTYKNYSTLPEGEHTAGGGLSLFVKGSSRCWYFRYQRDGKRRRIPLGSAETLSLSGARAKVLELKKKLREGLDLDGSPRERVFFADYYLPAIERIEKVRGFKNEKHASQWRSTIETYALPSLRTLSMDRIRLPDVLKVLEAIWMEKPETASRLRGRLESIFSLAIGEGIMKENPARWKDGLENFLPRVGRVKEVKHHAAMPFADLPPFIEKIRTSEKPSARCVIFGILTAVRAQEAVGARWSEVDLDEAVWTIPPERMKMKREHRIPLSRQAIEILRAQRERVSEKCEFIFPSPQGGGSMAPESLRSYVRKQTGQALTMHGFRSTFRDWCEENFVHPSLSERALAHVQGDKVVAAYQRSDLLEQRRPMMQQWADAIMPQ